jgi:hypothetical protein
MAAFSIFLIFPSGTIWQQLCLKDAMCGFCNADGVRNAKAAHPDDFAFAEQQGVAISLGARDLLVDEKIFDLLRSRHPQRRESITVSDIPHHKGERNRL